MYYNVINTGNASKWVNIVEWCNPYLLVASLLSLMLKLCHVSGAGVFISLSILAYAALSLVGVWSAGILFRQDQEKNSLSQNSLTLCRHAMHASVSMSFLFSLFRFQMWPGSENIGGVAIVFCICSLIFLFMKRNAEKNFWRLLAVTITLVILVAMMLVKKSSYSRYFHLHEDIEETSDCRVEEWYYYAMMLYDEESYDESSQAMKRAVICESNNQRLHQTFGLSKEASQVLLRADSLIQIREWTKENREPLW